MTETTWLLGIDTSNYTTSVAAVAADGYLLDDRRLVLPVASGERGLRQSEACFAHLRQLPNLFRELERPEQPPLAIAVSTRPRPLDDSYMPVFLVGTQFGSMLSDAWRCPLLPFSHQEGHLQAGIISAKGPEQKTFLALHLSGGTTELLCIERRNPGFSERLLGGSIDLHVGQFIDRVGVALGLPFPAGPHLEQLARQSRPVEETAVTLTAFCRDLSISFSGAESQAQRLIQSGAPAPDVARAVERCIARALEKLLRSALAQTGLDNVLLVGGVGSNAYIREQLLRRLGPVMELWFAEPRLCGDNAVGVAWLAAEQIELQGGIVHGA